MSLINLKRNLAVAMIAYQTNKLNMLKCTSQAVNSISKPMSTHWNILFSIKAVTVKPLFKSG